jgi:hypothetical protein
MSKPFQFTKRTGLYATGWLFLAAMAGWSGALALNYNSAAAVFGFVLTFNCFWASVDSLRGRPFARIVLERAILVFLMMMAYWFWRSNPQSTDTSGIDG